MTYLIIATVDPNAVTVAVPMLILLILIVGADTVDVAVDVTFDRCKKDEQSGVAEG